MSKLTLATLILGLVAGGLGFAGYQKASAALEDVHRLQKGAPSDRTDDASLDALAGEVSHLTARVASLELQLRQAQKATGAPTPAAPGPAQAAAPVAAAPEPTGSAAKSPFTLPPVPKDNEQREARKQQVSAAVASHWKAWGAQHGLTDQQTEQLAVLESDAARHKLDNQAKMVDGNVTQPEIRADNQATTEDVRRKARALLSPEQFSQFEADKGAEWGSSYRRVRQADAKAAAPPQ